MFDEANEQKLYSVSYDIANHAWVARDGSGCFLASAGAAMGIENGIPALHLEAMKVLQSKHNAANADDLDDDERALANQIVIERDNWIGGWSVRVPNGLWMFGVTKAEVLESGLDRDAFIRNKLVKMYRMGGLARSGFSPKVRRDAPCVTAL